MAPTIMIADDDLALTEALTVRLEAEGYRVIVSADGYQTLHQIVQLQPDVVLLDVNMPAGDGFTVLDRAARLGNVIEKTAVIFVTGEQSDRVENAVRDHGAFAVIRKPFATEELLETVKAALEYGVAA